jgi:hypothetical protein
MVPASNGEKYTLSFWLLRYCMKTSDIISKKATLERTPCFEIDVVLTCTPALYGSQVKLLEASHRRRIRSPSDHLGVAVRGSVSVLPCSAFHDRRATIPNGVAAAAL